jgi:hypothetical protein
VLGIKNSILRALKLQALSRKIIIIKIKIKIKNYPMLMEFSQANEILPEARVW